MASNAGVAMSPATNFDSWIEIYNPTEEIVDMGGMHLSYDENNLTMWQMPNTMGKVPAKGFKVIWLGSRDVIWTNAPFKLTCDGGTIYQVTKVEISSPVNRIPLQRAGHPMPV
jgi:hypothetical protein